MAESSSHASIASLLEVPPNMWDALNAPSPQLLAVPNTPYSFTSGARGIAQITIDPLPLEAGETEQLFICSIHDITHEQKARQQIEEKERQFSDLQFAQTETQFLWRLAMETPIYIDDSVYFTALGRKLREELGFAEACFLITPDSDEKSPEPFPGEMRVGSILREAAKTQVPEVRRRPARQEIWSFEHDVYGLFWMVSVRPKMDRPFFLIARPDNSGRAPDRRRFFESLAKQLSTWLDNRSMYLSSITDALTGLFNRRHFDSRFVVECLLARERRNVVSLILVDIDHFKKINDSFGHQLGDTVLKMMGALLKQTFRLTDFAARVGGEEFGILLFDTTPGDAAIAAEKIRQRVAEMPIPLPEFGQSIHVTISCGIAHYHGAAGQNTDTVYGAADEALYRAKTAGRNRVEMSEIKPLPKAG